MENRVRGMERRATLRGRADECALLDDIVSSIRQGESRSLVIRGEAGIGKTALLEYLLESHPDLSVVWALGVESEMELAYASLHQLCAPLRFANAILHGQHCILDAAGGFVNRPDVRSRPASPRSGPVHRTRARNPVEYRRDWNRVAASLSPGPQRKEPGCPTTSVRRYPSFVATRACT